MKKLFPKCNVSATRCRSLLFLIGLISTQLTGCFTVGQEFAGSRVPEIKIGQSTKQDIENTFGTPWRRGAEDGKSTWTYGIYKYYLFGPADTQDLLIRFDNQGIVRSYTFGSTRK
ncbi:MAG: outer membrane protein assembly factor BamE domain-containing protein [Gammaproteobacteria bacterium]